MLSNPEKPFDRLAFARHFRQAQTTERMTFQWHINYSFTVAESISFKEKDTCSFDFGST